MTSDLKVCADPAQDVVDAVSRQQGHEDILRKRESLLEQNKELKIALI